MSGNSNAGGNGGRNKYARGGGPGQRQFKPPQPKNEANRAAWERLKEKYESAHSDNLAMAFSKALKSLAASKEPITTYKEAIGLAHVGPTCAKVIFPLGEGVAPAMVARPAANKSKRKKTPAQEASQPSKKQASAVQTEGPSVKETRYQKAKEEAINNWTHPATVSSHGLVWKVLLLVDNREKKSQHIISKCSMSGIPAEERVLPIGDMTWVAQGLRKHRVNGKVNTTVEAELMLGTIIERKTTPDLVHSLFGTRYMEQRLRLQHSGLPQVLFLIEGDIQKDVCTHFPKERLQMALMETRAYLGFQMVFTEHMDATVQTLKRFHRRILQRTFPDAFGIENDALPSFTSPDANHSRQRTLPSAPTGSKPNRRRKRRPESLVEMVMDTPPVPAFEESRFITYEELQCKIERDREAGTRTIGAVFGAMLQQVCGQSKIRAIRETYPTPASLLQAYDEVADNPKKQSELVANCTESSTASGAAARRVGPKISSALYVACCSTPHESQRVTESNAGKRRSPEKEVATKPAPPAATKKTAKVVQEPRRAPTVAPTVTTKASSTICTSSASSTASLTMNTEKQSATLDQFRPRQPKESCVELLTSDDDDESLGLSIKKNGKQDHQEKENNYAKPALKTNIEAPSKEPVVMLDDSSDDDDEEDESVGKQSGSAIASKPLYSVARSRATTERTFGGSPALSNSSQEDGSMGKGENSDQFEAGTTVFDAIEID